MYALAYWVSREATTPPDAAKITRLIAEKHLASTETTVRSHIHALEGLIGEALIEQKGKVWELTEVGRALGTEAPRLVFASVADLIDLVQRKEDDAQGQRAPLVVGCFNAAVKHFLAGALAPLLRDPGFDRTIRFNPSMNLRTVASQVLLEGLGVSTDYAIVPWATSFVPPKWRKQYKHDDLYRWSLVVVTPDDHEFRSRVSIQIDEVVAACRGPAARMPLLLSPANNVSRSLVDTAFASAGYHTTIVEVVENPDSYTRTQLAAFGHGIAIAAADTVSAAHAALYPRLVDADENPIEGLYTLSAAKPSKQLTRPSPSVECDEKFRSAIVKGVDDLVLRTPGLRRTIN